LAVQQADVARLRKELAEVQATLAEHRLFAAGLGYELAATRASGRMVMNSWAWRLTRPVRRVLDVLSYVREIGVAHAVSSMMKRDFTKQLHMRRYLALIGRPGMFDASWYRTQYPDVVQAAIEPMQHYLLSGAAEGRNPGPLFDTSWYVDRYPDVRRAGINPFVHYLVRGALEGRWPHPRCAPEHRLASPALVLRAQPLNARWDPALGLPVNHDGPWLMCVSHVRPDPPRAGNAYRVQRMIRWAANKGFRVLLIHAPLPDDEPTDDVLAELAAVYPYLVVCRRDGTIYYHFEEEPAASDALGRLAGRQANGLPEYSAERPERRSAELSAIERTFAHDTVIAAVLTAADALKPKVVLVEYVFMTRFLSSLPADTLRVIDTHDVFSTKQKKVERHGISDSLALSADEEARYLARADVVIAIQPDEAEDLSRLAPGKRVVTAGVDFDLVRLPPAARGKVVLVVASDNAMNVKGVEDFVKLSWPSIKRQVPDAEFWVVGRVCRRMTLRSPGVDSLGQVDDLDGLYRAARVVINPGVAGTGVKIKTLEALSRLRPVVCWPSGVEGLPPELQAHCHIANNWYEFAVQVIRQLDDETSPNPLWAAQDSVGKMLAAEAVYADLETVLCHGAVRR
jgi:glycosyltransferase involved in cell wall biosynthesis